MLKNLVDHMKEIFKDELPEAIFIDENKNEIIDQETEQIDMIEIPLTKKEIQEIQEAGLRDVDDSAPVDENGNVIVIDDTTTPSNKKDEKKRKTRQELIRAAFKKKEENPDITYAELGRMFNRSVGTIKRYLAMSEEEVNSAHEKKRIQREKRLSPLKKYANLIYNMLVLGIDPLTIARYIYNHLDYQGSVSSLRGYITVLANKCLGRRITRYQMQQKVYPDGVIRIPRIAILWYIVKKKPMSRSTMR